MRELTLERFSRAVARIYDTALTDDASAVEAALVSVRDLVGADQVSLTVQHVHHGWASRRTIGFAADGPRYPAGARDNVLFHNLLTRHGVGAAQPDHRCVDRDRLVRSDYYNGFLRPHGIEHALGLVIRDDRGLVTWLSANRGSRGDAFDEEGMRALNLLHPHLSHAVAASRLLHAARTERDAAADAVAHLRWGMVLLDDSARPVFANARAEEIARQRRCIDLAQPGLGLQSALRARLRAALAGGRDGVRAGFSDVVADEKGRVSLLAVPVGAALAPPDHRGACLVLLLRAAEEEPVFGAEDLRQAYGLTAAEAEVAMLAARGLKVAEIAARRGTKYSTARTHLDTVLAKVGARTSRELAWRLREPG